MANIHSNINVLLLENTQGFLAGAILHRMGGNVGGKNGVITKWEQLKAKLVGLFKYIDSGIASVDNWRVEYSCTVFCLINFF